VSDKSLVSPDTRTRVKRLGEPIALFFGRLGLTPNGLTLIGFAITAIAAVLAAGQLWVAAGLVMFAGGVFDMFDGTLARATGQVSKVGAFMDSVLDRWGEALFYVGVIIGCSRADFDLGAGLAAVAMASAFLVSYTRAKSEGLGFTQGAGMAEVGLAPREIRLVILAIAIVAAGLAGGVTPIGGEAVGLGEPALPIGHTWGQLWMAAGLGLIAILATITVLQRIIHVRRQAAVSGGK
jgi:CDP-diacylglycerol--glycerol-3-phosphate 3-phosphatidyltransferase